MKEDAKTPSLLTLFLFIICLHSFDIQIGICMAVKVPL